MQHLEVSGAVRHIYIYVIGRLKFKLEQRENYRQHKKNVRLIDFKTDTAPFIPNTYWRFFFKWAFPVVLHTITKTGRESQTQLVFDFLYLSLWLTEELSRFQRPLYKHEYKNNARTYTTYALRTSITVTFTERDTAVLMQSDESIADWLRTPPYALSLFL